MHFIDCNENQEGAFSLFRSTTIFHITKSIHAGKKIYKMCNKPMLKHRKVLIINYSNNFCFYEIGEEEVFNKSNDKDLTFTTY